MSRFALLMLIVSGPVLIGHPAPAPAADDKPDARAALQRFNDLVGSWKARGTPEGSLADKTKGAWTETVAWGWQFKGTQAALVATFDQGKYFTRGELRPLADGRYEFQVKTTDGTTKTFAGPLKDKILTLECNAEDGSAERLVFSLLHNNRHLYRLETKPAGGVFGRRWQVGATKEGVEFASKGGGPECVVSGGLGTSKVMYKGETFWVCCSGCRDAFNDEPEKYVAEFKAKQAKQSK